MKLDALIRKLDAIGSSHTVDETKRRVAVEGLKLVGQSFRTGTDPYGVAWNALQNSRVDFHKGAVRVRVPKGRVGGILVKTGDMRDAIMALPSPSGIRFVAPVPYSGYHQYGAPKANVPIRRFFPTKWLGLPQAWKEMVKAAFGSTMREALRA